MNKHCTEVLNSPSQNNQYDVFRLIESLGFCDPASDEAFEICDAYSGFPMETLGENPMFAAIFPGSQDRELSTQERSLAEEYPVPELTFDIDYLIQGYQHQEFSDLQLEPSKALVASGCSDTLGLPFTGFEAQQTFSSDEPQYIESSNLGFQKFQVSQFPASSHQHMSCIDISSSLLGPSKEIEFSYKKPRKDSQNKRELSDLQQYYRPLSQTPTSWGSLNDYKKPIFVYNEHGELNPAAKYSAEQVHEYLYNNALRTHSGIHDPQNSGLILWIQTVPAFSSGRYPNQQSDKCRFATCPAPNNSILKGFYRVAFDEQTATGHLVDPFHCAGFVHLWCLEKFCDFPQMCKDLNIQPDIRHFPEGKNKMAITRDHEEMCNVVKRYMAKSQPLAEYDYMQTLNYRLTTTHLNLEADVRQALREERGGNHIGLHKGDLQKYAEGEEVRKRHGKSAILGREKKVKKRKLDGSNDEGTTELAAPSRSRQAKKSKNLESHPQEDPNYIDGVEMDVGWPSGTIRLPGRTKNTFPAGFGLGES